MTKLVNRRIIMRRNFAQVLKSGNIDIKKEYSKLFAIFYGRDSRDSRSLADIISANFENIYFRGTCFNLDEFDEEYGFHFVEQPQDFNVDYLVSFCEYIYNLVVNFDDRFLFHNTNKDFYVLHINKLMERIGYIQSCEDGFTIFVAKNNAAIAVSELECIPENVSYKVISYNHHSMQGEIDKKKQILLTLANILEPRRNELEGMNNQFTSDLFYAFNNFNIRHNNIDSNGTKYKKTIAELTQEQLEKWYDNVYQMCLLAFMLLENKSIKTEFNKLKSEIENKK